MSDDGPEGWAVRVVADRDYFELVTEREGPDAGAVTFPADAPVREVRLSGDAVRIGRAQAPAAGPLEIDLSGPPADPGVSRLHAVLRRRPDGGWVVLDPGSTNGTTINDDDEPIETDHPVPVGEGDRIHVGAWTTLVLTPVARRERSPA